MAIELSEKIRFYGKEALEERLNVATIVERDAIPLGERYNGMIVTVRSEGKRYELLYDGNFEELSESAKDAFLGSNGNWAEAGSGSGGSETAESVKIKYESNEDTNAFTDAEKLKLEELQNETGQTIADKYEGHEDVKRFTTALKAKVDGIETSGDGTKYKSNDGTYKTIDALPSQTGNAGKVLKTNGTDASWDGLETSDVNNLDTKLAGKESITNKGVAGGYAPLDATGKLPANMIPDSITGGVTYKGVWDASSGTAPNGSPLNGWYYKVSVAGTTNVDGNDEWSVGDWIIYNGTAWDRIQNSEQISSVQGQVAGDVVITDTNVDHQIGITIPAWISAIYTAGKASIRSVLDAIVSQITTMKNKLDGVENGATKNRPDSELLHLPNSTGALSGIDRVVGLQTALDAKLSIRGDNFICTRPGANAIDNGNQLVTLYNELKTFTPGGNPLSSSNRVTLIVFPGTYELTSSKPLNLSEHVDLVGFGAKENIRLIAPTNTRFVQAVNDVRLENFSLPINGQFLNIQTNFTNKSIYRNLIITLYSYGGYTGAFQGVYDNLSTPEGSGFGLFYTDVNVGGKHVNMSSPLSLGYETFEGANIYNCALYGGTFVNSTLIGVYPAEVALGPPVFVLDTSRVYNSLLRVKDGENLGVKEGTEIYNSVIDANLSRYGKDESPDPLDPIYDVKLMGNHCTGTVDPKLNNLIDNGHNSWDSEGGGEGGLTPEQAAKLANLPSNTNQEISDINSDLLAIGQDISDIEYEVVVLKNKYVVDIDFENAEPFVFKAPEAMKITSVEGETGITPTITGYTVGNNLAKYSTFTIEVNVPGMVTLLGELL